MKPLPYESINYVTAQQLGTSNAIRPVTVSTTDNQLVSYEQLTMTININNQQHHRVVRASQSIL